MNISNDLSQLVKLGVISEPKSKELDRIYQKEGFEAFRVAFSGYYESEMKNLKTEEKEIEKEIQSLNKQYKDITNKHVKNLERDARERAKQRKQTYDQLERLANQQKKIIDKETEAASRKIDEIIAEASQNIEVEILKKIREKIA